MCFFVVRYWYSAVSLTLVREQHFIRMINYYYINVNMIFYTHVEQSYQNNSHKVLCQKHVGFTGQVAARELSCTSVWSLWVERNESCMKTRFLSIKFHAKQRWVSALWARTRSGAFVQNQQRQCVSSRWKDVPSTQQQRKGVSWGGKRSREHIKKERELDGVERDPVNTSKKKGS